MHRASSFAAVLTPFLIFATACSQDVPAEREAASAAAPRGSDSELIRQVEEYLGPWVERGDFRGVVLIARGGVVLVDSTWGLGGYVEGDPRDAAFRIASLTKTITAGEATKTGTFHPFCAEFCGAEHSKMIGSVVVMERDEYQDWLGGGLSGLSPAESGQALFQQYACDTCHKTEATGRGPSLEGIAGREVTLTSGRTLVRDENYLRESIMIPGARVVQGYQLLMPTYQGQISEEGVLHLIAYIKSLGGDETNPPFLKGGTGRPRGDTLAVR